MERTKPGSSLFTRSIQFSDDVPAVNLKEPKKLLLLRLRRLVTTRHSLRLARHRLLRRTASRNRPPNLSSSRHGAPHASRRTRDRLLRRLSRSKSARLFRPRRSFRRVNLLLLFSLAFANLSRVNVRSEPTDRDDLQNVSSSRSMMRRRASGRRRRHLGRRHRRGETQRLGRRRRRRHRHRHHLCRK